MGKNRRVIIISLFILLLSFSSFIYLIFNSREHYQSKFNPVRFKSQYEKSQWIVPNSKNPISDETLYTYAGYKYLQGTNPILINPETPPLGKYLIGLSIILFKNQNIVIIFSAILSLALVFLIIYQASKSLLAGSLGILITVLHTSFREQLMHSPQLDMFQLLFLLLFLLFFSAYKKTAENYRLGVAGVFLGAFISIKFFLLYWLIVNATLLIFYFLKREKLSIIFFELLTLNLIGLFIYTLTYTQYFVLGGNLRSFLGTQKWIALFYANSNIDISKLYGNYLSLIFLNKWRFWQNDFPYYPYKYWNIVWPITFITGVYSAYQLIKKRKKKKSSVIYLLVSFLLIYNIFLFITPIYPRYLLLLFVPLNILIAIYLGRLLEEKLLNFKL